MPDTTSRSPFPSVVITVRRFDLLFTLITLVIIGVAIAAYLLNVPTIIIVVCTPFAIWGGWRLTNRIKREPPPSP